ncbi:sigma-54-dependent Fis family transcriptional regulator [Desulforhopalus vacuolatus]|uniref:sigma-54-dependent transcriptional regulator n=1 Tax=Desulforhopalus vacuolatus TaxID=40414 RepID=UPI0019654D51|nr:sigma-54 dependent transcriptional regulator [Desulforhopalus vacuolatus]MBM9520269.1 sigma-54-dependent Fis family transcriptional regulator [Desulforhopalus vacuolatus]
MKPKIFKALIVDDEEGMRGVLTRLMTKINFEVVTASGGETALQLILSELPDVMLLDFRMSGMDGKEVLQAVKYIDPDLPIIMITGYADISTAVEMVKAGVYDYLAKPFDNNDVIRIVQRAVSERNLKKKFRNLSCQFGESFCLREMMGSSEAVQELVVKVNKVANSNFSTIIIGETGSGKELVSHAIHHASHLSAGPFYAIDCGAIVPTLLESELFGHEKGAFTGAVDEKPGKLEEAKGGTILLDEITNMPLDAQAKLLRVLQEKEMYRVGGTEPIKLDVRILAASNQDLTVAIADGTFRSDLYYRLNEFVIRIPPLRERKEDIPCLVDRFMKSAFVELNKEITGITSSAMEVLLAYDWPGNVRQLRSTIRRAVLLADKRITEKELPQLDTQSTKKSINLIPDEEFIWDDNYSFKTIMRQHTQVIERKIISQVLILAKGNKAKAARMLKIDYKTIHSKLKLLGISNVGEEKW